MIFFKRLFSTKQEEIKSDAKESSNFERVYSTEYFDKRYSEHKIEAKMLDGCIKK